MTILDSIRNSIPPVHREGYPFIAIFLVATLLVGWFWDPFYWVGGILTVWCALFFRDPLRITTKAPGLIISPADGIVSSIQMATPPPELELSDGPLLRISVFMNVFNVHVNRAPIAGTISRLAYRPGKFLNAELDKASDDNERSSIVLETDFGRIGVTQIAGLIARRIVPFVKENDVVDAGFRFGMIRFGSRVDVYLPEGTDVYVAEGQTAIAGETILANLGQDMKPAPEHVEH
ncbi:MAG: phosphatidylserine decarboxylase [Cohaesibacteraceae bacterium]|nr:phosphatidylserine decarboxylase [Cohaesibacteraceae bacterium]